MRRAILSCASVMLLLILQAGCWDSVDVNELSIVTGIAIENGDERKYKLTVEALNPVELVAAKSGGFAPAIIFTLEGDSISELTHKMNFSMSRRLNYTHMRVLVLSEQMLQKGDMDFLDFLERFRQSRDDFYIMIAKGASPADILKITNPVHRVSSLKLFRQMNSLEKDYLGNTRTNLRNFIKALSTPGREPVATALAIEGKTEKGADVDNNKNLEPDAIVRYVGTGVFVGERLVGYLTPQESRNLSWILNRVDQTSLDVACEPGKALDVRVYNSKTSIHVAMENEKPRIRIHVDVETKLNGTQCNIDLSKMDTYRKLEELITKEIETEIKGLVRSVQKKYKADIFGFGEALNRQHYKQFKPISKEWNRYFAQAEVEVSVDAKLRRTGIRVKPAANDSRYSDQE